ncbi:pyridoxamine 5'-phosphate oxidase family protein [Clostridium intestinale]|uniref:Pyridox oxidase n=1 Tax=Clostridium intestinale URNW TaxID=1294142 RepID=U2PVP7_9CLOT|nr:pyridoxamine 5'-phosphate oxidase family protein [Clostridium intestinale]ERK30510.1 pyridox oxidase [Clostridium intestinale URNW]
MDIKKEFLRIMKDHTEIALGTNFDNQSNVRIVNFYYEEASNLLFFTSFNKNNKVKEFKLNPNISFTTIPHEENEHIRAKGQVIESSRTIYDLREAFVNKFPFYEDLINQVGESLILFEVHFSSANVTLDMENSGTISLE